MDRKKDSGKEFGCVDGGILAVRAFEDGVPVSGASSSVVKKRERDEVEYRHLYRAHDERSDDELIDNTGISIILSKLAVR